MSAKPGLGPRIGDMSVFVRDDRAIEMYARLRETLNKPSLRRKPVSSALIIWIPASAGMTF
jgi:hypothetical protein